MIDPDLDDPNSIPDFGLATAIAELARLDVAVDGRDAALDACAGRIDGLLKAAERAKARRIADVDELDRAADVWHRAAFERAQAHQDAQATLEEVAAERDRLVDRVRELKEDLSAIRHAHVQLFRQFGEAIGCHNGGPTTVLLAAKALRQALFTLRELMLLDLREWATCHTDAWLYAILVGWEPAQFRALVRRWRWSNETRDRVLELREAVAAITR